MGFRGARLGVVAVVAAVAACSVPPEPSTGSLAPPLTLAPSSASPSASSLASPPAAPSRVPSAAPSPVPSAAPSPVPSDLADRRRPTVDHLPPPASGGYESTVSPLTPAQVARSTWRPGCPVAPARLRRLTMSFRGFDGRAHTGEMIVRDDVATAVVAVFGRLFAAGFPLEEMRPVTPEDLVAAPSGLGNDTAAFACRPATGQTRFSAHAYGLAVDVDPFQNPLHRRDGLVVPERASAYVDRSVRRPGMIRDGDVVVGAFTRIGWTWGGRFDTPVDTMHFSATGD